MAHGMMSMVSKKGPAKCLGSMVSNIDDARDMMHDDDDTMTLPLLNGKMLDVNVSGIRSGLAFIDHGNGGDIVFIERCGTLLWNAKLMKDGTKVFSNLGSMHSGDEFSLS